VQEYVNGIEYRGTTIPATTIEGIYHAEGRLYNNAGTWQREYVIKDHLGDTRIAYADINGDGVIATPSEILQENNYDAFGYGLDGVYMNHSNPDNLYQYNGKEKNDDHSTGMYDYGARWYDAGVGRFTTIDRFADKYTSLNPYQYGANNPIKYVDINGDSIGINIVPGGGSNGKDRYDFTVTGKIIDDTRVGLSPKKLEKLRKEIVKGIQESFTGSDEDVEYNVTTTITTSSSESDLNSSDHAFRIVDDLKGSGETGGDPNLVVAGSTPPYQNVVFLNAKSLGNLSRTAAHELGHGAGLGHIKDSYQTSNGQFKRLTVDDYPSNLMHQSRDVLNPGNGLASFQIRHIGVLFQAGKLNKGNQK
jgi:RHS repeat-associated protein